MDTKSCCKLLFYYLFVAWFHVIMLGHNYNIGTHLWDGKFIAISWSVRGLWPCHCAAVFAKFNSLDHVYSSAAQFWWAQRQRNHLTLKSPWDNSRALPRVFLYYGDALNCAHSVRALLSSQSVSINNSFVPKPACLSLSDSVYVVSYVTFMHLLCTSHI